jgi:Coenzyme PQQ synthesis protein D (PqqD)
MALSIDTIVSRNETNFLSNPVGDEIIILNMETGDYLGLNSVGSAIWEQLSSPKSVNQIIEKLMIEFEVEREICLAQTLEYLEKINTLGLLKTGV